jgi:fumarate hydratase subunit alpha
MRELDVSRIKDAVTELCLKANFDLRRDVLGAIKHAFKGEKNERAKGILRSILENARLAKGKRLAICQDTGMVCVFLEIGQEVNLVGQDLREAIHEGVREAYRRGYLRKSVVGDPLVRKNTMDNTPCVLHIDIVKGDRVKIIVSPKGFGCENKSAIRMFNPTSELGAIKDFVVDVVRRAGPDACPPFVLGIGIGGTFEESALLAKRALNRPMDRRNPKRHYAKLERELLADINSLKIGPMGLGGSTTALGVNIVDAPTHIAGLPVAVSLSCHATRAAEKVL